MSRSKKAQTGATLIEILLCISIIVILNSFAVPQMQKLKAYYDSRSTQKSLSSLVTSARARALYRQQIVTLCPMSESDSCHSDWNSELAVFTDHNSNATLDADEEIFSIWNQMPAQATLSWTLDRRYIRFRPNGATSATTGSLRYCETDLESQNNFRIVLARTGRTRIDRDDHGCH